MKVVRWKHTLFAGVIASAVLVMLMEAESFAHAFDNWMTSILIWISPWATIVLVDYFVLRRGRLDVPSLYTGPRSVNWRGL